MTAPARDRRDRLRAMLADLKMPGALEAVDGVLAKVDSGAVTAGEAIEPVLAPRSRCATTVACRPRCAPRACRPSRRWRVLRSVLSLMGVDLAAPDHTTLSRRSQSLAVEFRRIPSRGPIHLIVDSTGRSIVGEGEWVR